MPKVNSLCKKSIYTRRKYWYHLSSTLKHTTVFLKPWDNDRGFNRSWKEPNVERICVAPSMAHCLAALPYCPGDSYNVYRTKNKVKANSPSNVFDSHITLEGWIQKPTVFVKIGELTLEDVEEGDLLNLPQQVASDNNPRLSGRVLAWWKKRNLWKYLERV
jgi:hypothetical protein